MSPSADDYKLRDVNAARGRAAATLAAKFAGIVNAETVQRCVHESWDLPHPDGSDLDAIRAVRDEIDARVRALLTELTGSPA